MKGIEFQEFPPSAADQPEETVEKKESFLERLKTIIRVVARKPNLVVTTEVDPVTRIQFMMKGEDPDKTWFRYSLGNVEYVHIPEEIALKENEAFGIACHEAGFRIR